MKTKLFLMRRCLFYIIVVLIAYYGDDDSDGDVDDDDGDNLHFCFIFSKFAVNIQTLCKFP